MLREHDIVEFFTKFESGNDDKHVFKHADSGG